MQASALNTLFGLSIVRRLPEQPGRDDDGVPVENGASLQVNQSGEKRQ
jgi:hypothetical protein